MLFRSGFPCLVHAKSDSEVLGVEPGSVTPFGLINDRERRVNVVLDQAMMAHELLNFHPLRNDATTTIAAADLLKFIEQR